MATQLGYSKGALFGLLAGMAMAIVTMIITAATGMGVWAMPKMIATIPLGQSAMMTGGAVAIIVGFIVHFILSAIFGMIYAGIVTQLTHEFLVTAVAFGLLLWIVNFYVIGLVMPTAHMMALQEPLWQAIFTHLIFGVTLGSLGRGAGVAALHATTTT